MSSGLVLIRRRVVWLAWYPKRGRRCTLTSQSTVDGWYFDLGVGPLYLGLGPGTPSP